MGFLKNIFNKYKYKYTVYINGMNCKHCSARIEQAFNSLDETKAEVNLEGKYAIVSTNKEFTDDDIKTIVTDTGFTFVKVIR